MRAVVDLSTMTLVEYATPEEYPDGPVRCDQSLFVPIFCKECYGTQDSQHRNALEHMSSSDVDTFVVGMCSVYGVAADEVYPDSRREYMVKNELSFSGACHPQPGKALFMHKTENEIGTVKCYWHVHSRSTNKTFLYCCVARTDTEYAIGVVQPETGMGFSLGTVGDNAKGPIVEECSLVSWPMRPGCFCVVVSRKDLSSTMMRMGFSIVKDSILQAGEKPGPGETLDAGASEPATECVASESSFVPPHEDAVQDVQSLHKMLTDQMTEIRILKDMLEAVKVQNNLFTRLLKGPDEDALFTLQGAREFSRRTGTETRLCAGDNTTDDERVNRDREHTSIVSADTNMSVTQAQVDEILKLLQKQQPQQQDIQQTPLCTLNHLQPSPMMYQWQTQRQPNDPSHHQRYGHTGFNGVHPTSSYSGYGDSQLDYDNLTQEQRRKIALAYNKEQDEKQAALQKEHDRMLESIKASIRDAIKEQQQQQQPPQPVTLEPQGDRCETLHTLAMGTPYKRVTRDRGSVSNENNIATLTRELRELRELTEELSRRDEKPKQVLNTENQTSDMEAENSEATTSIPEPSLVSNMKQQAGYGSAKQAETKRPVRDSVSDFIAAVVTKD